MFHLKKSWELYIGYSEGAYTKTISRFLKTRKELNQLLAEIICYDKVNDNFNDKFDSNCQEHRDYLFERRKYLRQTKELVENINALTERLLLLQIKHTNLKSMMQAVRQILNEFDMDSV